MVKLLQKIKRKRPANHKGKESGWSWFVTILFAVALRTFFAEPFAIPSGSMIPTLLVGDYLFVSKFSWGFCRYSFLFGYPAFEGRYFAQDPTRGQVAVFMGEDRYIKRIIGLPGDKVQLKRGIVYINGEMAKQERIEDYVTKTATGRTKAVPQLIETLPGGVSHKIIRESLSGEEDGDNTKVFDVPQGHYFMMGDNRNNSGDSRFEKMGMVPFDNLVGPAKIVFLSVDSTIWDLMHIFSDPDVLRWRRFFSWIK